jgi:hypothetical protein
MKNLSTLLLAGALALSFGTATGFAGERVLQTQGRAGYRSVVVQDRDTTVALFGRERRDVTKETGKASKPQATTQTQGRAGYKPVKAD